ncbi:MAG TPA: sulfite exporter TauE/SafE family protein [Streptosporangiaceae bacterium]
MSSLAALAIFAAAVAAGTINAVVGSGSLITFPTLLALGYPPVVANVSNNIGVIPGNVTASFGYRAELTGQRDRLLRLGVASFAGALTGAVALLALPAGVFKLIVPVLIIAACVLVILQPKLSAWVAGHNPDQSDRVGPVLIAGVYLTGVYGGYFGAAQGVLLVGLLGVFLTDNLQRINAGKNVLVTIVNAVAALIFVIFAHVAWLAVALIAVGSGLGGVIGAKIGRRLHPLALRIIIVIIGVVSAVKLIFFP